MQLVEKGILLSREQAEEGRLTTLVLWTKLNIC